MRSLSLALALAASVAGARFQAPAQRPAPPRYSLQEEWRIAQTVNIRDVGFIKFAPDGRLIIAPYSGSDGEMVAMDSGGTKVEWRMPMGWGRDKEVRGIQSMGFVGGTMWVSDRSYQQVALINAVGKVTKSLEHPTFVRPQLSERKKFPVYDAFDALAVYADGTWLVRPLGDRSENRVVDTPEYDSTSVHLLRVSESGVIQRIIAKYPEDPIIDIKSPGRRVRMGVYFGNRALVDVSQDGTRIAIVHASLAGKDSGTYRVTTLNERGDTIFNKRFAFTAQPITAASRDSALRRNNGADIKAEQEKRMPHVFTPVLEVVIGRDRTTWLKLRSAAADSATVTHLVLDAKGEPAALVTLPLTVTMVAADRSHVWGVEKQKGNLRSVVRYKLIAR